MAQPVSPTDFSPKYHATLSDGTTTVGFVFSNSGGQRDDRAAQRFPLVRTAIKIAQGESKYSDLALPYATIAQDDFSGGRGSEEFESDRRRFFDSRMADTTKSDGITLAGAPIYARGYRNQDNNLPGQLTSGHFYSHNLNFVTLFGATRFRAASFTASASYTSNKAEIWIQREGSPGTLTLELRADSAGSPGAVLRTTQAFGFEVPDIITELRSMVWGAEALNSGTKYWIVVYGANTDTINHHWKVGTRGGGQVSSNGSSWASGDGPSFRVTDADKSFRALFFEYKGQLYFVTKYDDATTSKVFINGDRGFATSNSSDLSKVNSFTPKNWATNQWRGSLVEIIEGTGAMEERNFRYITGNTASSLTVGDQDDESDPWTIPHHTLTSPFDFKNTHYLIVGSEEFRDLNIGFPAGTVIRDLDVAGETVFMAAGEGAPGDSKFFMRRFNMFAQTHEISGESGIQASFVRVVRDAAVGDVLWWARNHEPGKRVTIASSFFPDTGGGLVRGHREIPHSQFWLVFCAPNVVCDDTVDGKPALKIAAAFTTGVIASTGVSPPADLRAGNKILFELRSTIDMAPGDLDLLMDDTAGGGSPILVLPLPALKANMKTVVTLDYNTLGVVGGDAIVNMGLQLNSEKPVAFNIILGEELAIVADRPSIGVGKKDDRITGLESYGDPENLWVLKEGGFWEVENNVPTQAPIREFAAVKGPDNGRAHAVADVYLYTSLGEGVERYFRQNLEDVGPNLDAGLPRARRGPVVDMVSYPGRLFMAVDAGPSGISSVVVRTGSGYHELYRAPRIGQRIRSLYVQTIPGSTVQRLWISQGSDVLWIPISLSPVYDNRFRFRHESIIETGWVYSNMHDVLKHFSSLKIFVETANTLHHSIFVDYKLDNESDYRTIDGNFVSSSSVVEFPLSEGVPPSVKGRRIRFRIRMYTRRGELPLRIKAIALETYSQNPLRYGYSWTTKISEGDLALNLEDEDSQTLGAFPNVEAALEQLDRWAQELTPLTLGSVYNLLHDKVVVLDAMPVRPMTLIIDEGTEEHFVQVSVSELRNAIPA